MRVVVSGILQTDTVLGRPIGDGELWPDADRGRCAVHRLRNILAKLPERPGLHARVRAA